METNKGYGEADLPLELWEAQQAVESLRLQLRKARDERRLRVPIPDVLYHYTSLSGMHGMFSTFKMWLSDAAYMNDPLEGTWVHRRASLLTREVLGESPLATQTQIQIDAQLEAPDPWDERLRSPHGPEQLRFAALEDAFRPAFIASFTEDGDLLSQWRGYGAGGDGVSIGFNLNDLTFSGIPGVFADETLRWRRKFGQLAKVGSTSMKDGLYDWEAEAVHG